MLDLRRGPDVRDALRALTYVIGVIAAIAGITHFYPFNNLVSLLVLSSGVLIGAIWIRLAPSGGIGNDRYPERR
jgi:hypothetical protein